MQTCPDVGYSSCTSSTYCVFNALPPSSTMHDVLRTEWWNLPAFSIDDVRYEPKTSVGASQAFAGEFLRILKELNFEYGYVSDAEKYLEQQLKTGSRYAITRKISVLFDSNIGNERLAEYILYVVSCFPYEDMNPFCVELPKKALMTESEILKEGGIRCFEAWENPAFLPLLEKTECRSAWLREYLHSVIKGLKEIREAR